MKSSILLLALCLALSEIHQAAAHPGSGIAVDEQGQVFFTDTGSGVWRVDQRGQLAQISKSAMHWMAYDKEGRFSEAPDEFGEWFGRLTPKGQKPTLISCSDFPCAVGKDGNLYYAKMHSLTIVRRTPAGTETVLASPKSFGIDGNRPVGANGMVAGEDGAIYLVSLESLNRTEGTGEHRLYAIAMDGSPRMIAKDFVPNLLPVAEQHPEVRPQYCRGMAVDRQGNVFIAVTGSRCIIKVTPQSEVTVVLNANRPWSPTGVDVSNGDLYVLEYDDETPTEGRNWPPRVRRMKKDGTVTTIASLRAPINNQP